MADWHDAAKRGLTPLDSDTSGEGTRTSGSVARTFRLTNRPVSE